MQLLGRLVLAGMIVVGAALRLATIAAVRSLCTPDCEWTLPESWGACSVAVEGGRDTSERTSGGETGISASVRPELWCERDI